MKTRVIFLILLIANFSCSMNKSASDAEKEKIKGEVKEVVNTIFKALEEVNFDMAIEANLDSPDFVFLRHGKIYSYEEHLTLKPNFNTLSNQKVTINSEKFTVLDNSTVLYTTNCKWICNYKEGHTILQDPWVIQMTFKKIDNRWRVIYIVESGYEQNVANTETSSKLNQVELNNQLIGSWKFEYGKDTTGYADFTTYGTGIDATIKYVSKGKTFMERRINWAYDKTLDKMIGLSQFKGGGVVLVSVQWISKNKYVFVDYKGISNPEEASWKIEGTLKSHDVLEIKYYENNKPVKTLTYTRVK